MWRSIFLVCLLSNCAFGRDFLLEALQQSIDFDADPCDDFYRHVCPMNKTVLYRFDYDGLNEDINGYWKYLQLTRDFSRPPKNATDQIADFYKNMCESGRNTTEFLMTLEKYYSINEHYCESNCILHLQQDPNCTRGSVYLTKNILNQFDVEKSIKETYYYFYSWLENSKDIAMFEKHNLTTGVNRIEEMIEQMKVHAESWIKSTPWAKNARVTDVILATLNSTTLIRPNIEEHKKETFEKLFNMESAYRECKETYNNIPDANVFCFYVMGNDNNVQFKATRYFNTDDNAYNGYPSLIFGLPAYYESMHTDELAARLGSAGGMVGHELGHSIVADGKFSVLTYFSNPAAECILNQYNSTCTEYKEHSCTTTREHLDEDAADIIGIQLSYALFADFYKKDSKCSEIYKPLNVTNEQLFFYSMAQIFCKSEKVAVQYDGTNADTHAVSNVRVNVMAQQMPEFKKAFKCSDESRMMRTATDQCIVYGENAPAVRKRK